VVTEYSFFAPRASSRRGPKRYTTGRALAPLNVMHCPVLPNLTASVFIKVDESGLHQECEVWLAKLPPHAPISHYQHNDTQDTCPEGLEGTAPAPIQKARTWDARWSSR
jgi:hypothetical protein